MICPGCNQEVAENSLTCSNCGYTFYGPRNVSLNTPKFNQNQAKEGNIQNITGIDFNDISYDLPERENTISEPVKPKKVLKFNFKLFFFILLPICVGLAIAVGVVAYNNNKTEIINIKGTNMYNELGITFKLPEKWYYKMENDKLYLFSKDQKLLISKFDGNFEEVDIHDIKDIYAKNNYTNLAVEENVINDRKVIYVYYYLNGNYYFDFYYNIADNVMVYGNANEGSTDIQTNLKLIVESLKMISDDIDSYYNSIVNNNPSGEVKYKLELKEEE